MNALADVAANPGIGWIIGGMCWLVLRLIARMDSLEKAMEEVITTLDEINRKLT